MRPKDRAQSLPAAEEAARARGLGSAPITSGPHPDRAPEDTPTHELDLAAIAKLVAAELEGDPPRRKAPAPPKGPPARTTRGHHHASPGLGWSTATVVIVALVVLAIIVLGIDATLVYLRLHT